MLPTDVHANAFGLYQRPTQVPLSNCPPLPPAAVTQQYRQLQVTPIANRYVEKASEEASGDECEPVAVSTQFNQTHSSQLFFQNYNYQQQPQLYNFAMQQQPYQSQPLVKPVPPARPTRPEPVRSEKTDSTKGGAPNRQRAAYNRYQREFLNAVFESVQYPSRVQREAISRCLGGVVNQNQIKVWFQNARRRAVVRGKMPSDRQRASTPTHPQQATSAGSQMANCYFATIRTFVNQIVELGDGGKEVTKDDEAIRPKVNKRSLADETADEESAAKRPNVIGTTQVTENIADEIPVESPNRTAESGIGTSFQSSVVMVDGNDDQPSSSSVTSNEDDTRSGMSSAASGVYTSPTYGTMPMPLAGSTPNPNYQVSSFVDQRLVLANAMRYAQENYCRQPGNGMYRSACAYSPAQFYQQYYQQQFAQNQ